MDSTREASILGRLDDILSPGLAFAADLGSSGVGATRNSLADGEANTHAKRISASTSDKAYRKLTAHDNVTSYSLLLGLHECPRKYELDKYMANSQIVEVVYDFNPDFAFGHAVGAGIQTYAVTNNLQAALFSCMLSWKGDWDAEKTDAKGNPTGKSLTWACYAVEKFAGFWNTHLSEYEVLVLPNGNPAVELAFSVDFENGYFHFGHIDLILVHRETKRLVVWEGKTTGLENVSDAMYANSNQAVGYSVVVDAVAPLIGADSTDYEVYYIVYSSKTREFQLLAFTKSRTQRAEWLQDILLDHSAISTYKRLSFFPKRGEACFNSSFKRQCKYFGTCSMSNTNMFPEVSIPVLTRATVGSIESLDYTFTLTELIDAQQGKAV